MKKFFPLVLMLLALLAVAPLAGAQEAFPVDSSGGYDSISREQAAYARGQVVISVQVDEFVDSTVTMTVGRSSNASMVEDALDATVEYEQEFPAEMLSTMDLDYGVMYGYTRSGSGVGFVVVMVHGTSLWLVGLEGPSLSHLDPEEFGVYLAHLVMFGIDTDPPAGFQQIPLG